MNLGLYYYREYFRGLPLHDQDALKNTDLSGRNQLLTNFLTSSIPVSQIEGCTTLELKTTYPGVIVGTGYVHEVNALGEFKLGLFFDHSTGLPVIPGSSVKGAIRAAFPGWDAFFTKETPEEIKQAKTCWIESILQNKAIEEIVYDEPLKQKIKRIEEALFDGVSAWDEAGRPKSFYSIYQRTVFFDAWFEIPPENTPYLQADAITPHIRDGKTYEESQLLNPVPIPFVKIGPDIPVSFHVGLQPVVIPEYEIQLDENAIRRLFTTILTTTGIGAKTNVGYGQLTEPDKKLKPRHTSLKENIPQEILQVSMENKLKKLEGEIVAMHEDECLCKFQISGIGIELLVVKKKDKLAGKKTTPEELAAVTLGTRVFIQDYKYQNEPIFAIRLVKK